ncbi:hypothetical protein A3H22_01700 [Candidatus Peribacteria bacterium RIFCSPLOWO2_12_FULL_55_15]|nr:MAG: hypothetical protein A2789_02320 [Candidatus Peribacteria bacterium RIFCSPHIGHO2_01_FULL_54_22]OGJ62650.1 MAG: hypothetical protein A3D12_03750 [Candidatus Peribacteria bacterium RIFCSPHIGHO2_02_FULL_55_24]OGJ64166.1 MAG: hypothetical protein A3E47_03785 [Candidatus Peribacteria bacterium RIFCSPHIGHO2_12_FULL_54_10]OGJ68374.1 MAG: hypothetical protein A2947_02585 [Candidatus Peribacteria bacterium RIFCSPLOWO2_01_FULL_54_110]OGJ72281.1 MAG: hypothetical protein A3H22_01700 [Candidatus Pe
MRFRRFFGITLLGGSLLLAGCAGGKEELSCREQYWDGVFGTCLPSGWKSVEPVGLRARGVPEEVIAVFQADQFASNQIPTVMVTKEPLVRDWDAASYSDASIKSVQTLSEFSVLDERDVTVDGAKIRLHTFSAQPIPEEPAKRFYQLSTVVRKVGYTVTATLPLSPERDLEKQVLFILNGVTFRSEE